MTGSFDKVYFLWRVLSMTGTVDDGYFRLIFNKRDYIWTLLLKYCLFNNWYNDI